MSVDLIAVDKSGGGSASDDVELILDELDLFRAVLDEWSRLETARSALDSPLDMSSTFRVLLDRFESLDEAARRVLRP